MLHSIRLYSYLKYRIFQLKSYHVLTFYFKINRNSNRTRAINNSHANETRHKLRDLDTIDKNGRKGIVNGSRVPSDASESARRIRKSSRGNYADCRLEYICWWLERGILETTWVHPRRRTNYQSVLPVRFVASIGGTLFVFLSFRYFRLCLTHIYEMG